MKSSEQTNSVKQSTKDITKIAQSNIAISPVPLPVQLRQLIKIQKHNHNDYHLCLQGKVDPNIFLQYLKCLQANQSQQNSKKDRLTQTTSIWVHLNIKNLQLVSFLCCETSFNYKIHTGLGTNIDMYKWLLKRMDAVPPFSVFYVGCGAVLIHNQCIFMVQENSGDRRGRFGVPGGRADPGQTIKQCVQRELFQQTNIKAKFKYIIQFREANHAIYDCVDNYFACYMEYQEKQLQNLRIDETQLLSYKWVPLQDYYEFTLKNSSQTQCNLAEFIVKLWKSGYDFKNSQPNLTNSTSYVKNSTNQIMKSLYHNLINTDK